jgi:hypothetical protein
VTLRRRVQAVPSNNNGARPLIRVEPQQEIGEAEYRASCIAIAAANGFRQRVVRSMGEGVAVDDQQRAARGIMLARANGWVWRLSGTPVPRADFLAFDEALVGVVASRLPPTLPEVGGLGASRSSTHTGVWSLASSSPRM